MPTTNPILNRKLTLVLGAWGVYILAFVVLHDIFLLHNLEPALTALAALPIMVTASFFGMWAGLLSALLAFPLNMLTLLLAAHDPRVMLGGSGLLGSIIVLVVGAVVGRMSDLQARVARELAERKQMEEALHLFRKLLDESADALFIVDVATSRFLDMNKQACRGLQYSREELLQRGVLDIQTAMRDAVAWRAHVQELRAKSHLLVEFEVRRKDDTRFPVEVNTQFVEVAGKPYIVTMVRDITERKRAETELDRLRKAVDASGEVIFMTDREGVITLVNPEFTRLYGFTASETVGKTTPRILKSGLIKDADYEFFWQTLLSKQIIKGELINRTKDGRLINIEASANPILDGQGEIAGFLALQRDITERKRGEESLREKLAALQALAEIDREILAATDISRLLALVCRHAAELLRAPKTVVATSDSSLEMTMSASFGLADAAARGAEFTRHWREVELLRSDSATHNLIALDEIPADDPTMPEFRARENIHALMVAPLVVSGQVRGALAIFDTAPRQWTTDERQLIELLAEQSAMAFDKALLFAEQQTRRAELSALYDLARALTETDDLNAILELIARSAVQILHITFACLALVEGGALVIRAAHPVRVLERDLQVGQKEPLEAHPFYQQVLADNAPIVLHADDARISAAESGHLLLDVTQSACLVPLHSGTTPLGLLLLGEARSVERESFTVDKIRLAHNIGDQASSAVHRALLHAKTKKQIQQLDTLHWIDMAISSSTDLRPTLNTLADHAARQLGADAVGILLYDPATLTLKYAAGHGFRIGALTRSSQRLGQGYAGRAVLERHTILLPDLVHAENLARRDLMEEEGFVSYVGAPLIAKGQIKGILEIFQRTPFDPDQQWVEFCETLAQQAAIAIDSAQAFDGLQRSALDLALAYDDTLEGWARALELRDQETEGHSQRVTEMTLQLTRAMGLGEDEIMHIRRGALLHDIGKMGVPDAILLKPGKLTDDEWKIMRQHPQHAYDLLKSIAYLRPALDIPYCHHEKWDSTGYPRGLKGGEIPLAARIFAVVDVWDALMSNRLYRAAWSEEKVRAYIREQAGKHFDPKAVELFLTVMSEKAHEHKQGAG